MHALAQAAAAARKKEEERLHELKEWMDKDAGSSLAKAKQKEGVVETKATRKGMGGKKDALTETQRWVTQVRPHPNPCRTTPCLA